MKKLLRILLVAVAGALIWPANLSLAQGPGPRDCDNNAVVFCGAQTKMELIRKINQGDSRHSAQGLQQIMFKEGRGITQNGVLSTDTKNGQVRRDGTVWVSGKKVATGAMSSGRAFMPGSRRSGSIWMRPTSTSFRSASLDAFVNMQDGQFRWAIIKSCGNPVEARPVTQPKPQAKPKPEREVKKVVVKEVQSQPLPEAGAGEAVLSLVGLSAVWYSVKGYVRSRRRLKREFLSKL